MKNQLYWGRGYIWARGIIIIVYVLVTENKVNSILLLSKILGLV